MIRFVFHPNEGSGLILNSIIIFGEKSGTDGIIFREKPSIGSAINVTEHSPPYNESIYIHWSDMETIYFHDPCFSHKIKFRYQQHSLKIIESDIDLSPASVFHVFKYILIRKGSKFIFLTNGPNDPNIILK